MGFKLNGPGCCACDPYRQQIAIDLRCSPTYGSGIGTNTTHAVGPPYTVTVTDSTGTVVATYHHYGPDGIIFTTAVPGTYTYTLTFDDSMPAATMSTGTSFTSTLGPGHSPAEIFINGTFANQPDCRCLCNLCNSFKLTSSNETCSCGIWRTCEITYRSGPPAAGTTGLGYVPPSGPGYYSDVFALECGDYGNVNLDGDPEVWDSSEGRFFYWMTCVGDRITVTGIPCDGDTGGGQHVVFGIDGCGHGSGVGIGGIASSNGSPDETIEYPGGATPPARGGFCGGYYFPPGTWHDNPLTLTLASDCSYGGLGSDVTPQSLALADPFPVRYEAPTSTKRATWIEN